MISLDGSLKAAVADKVAALRGVLNPPGEGAAIYIVLSACAALGRDTAQKSWTLRYESADRDNLMKEDEDALVFEILQLPLSSIYEGLSGQVQNALRDTFDDEHFRLEDPDGWAEIHADTPTLREVHQ